jgi:N-acyl-D-amino-acid deacylase
VYDLIVRNGKVYDGTGAPWVRADVGVIGDRIAAIGNLRRAHALRSIDAEGLCVSPGFIDIHSHSDITVLVNPKAESKIRQGVTTEVVGQCGSSPAPINDRSRPLAEAMAREYGIEFPWSTMAEYAAAVSAAGPSVNIVPVVGHSAIRAAVMGMDRRPPTAEELGEMMHLVRLAMEDGARGFSSGLIYPPSSYADSDELASICGVVAMYDGIYMTHMRNESEGLLESVDETLAVGRQSGVRIQISHHKAVGRPNWGLQRESLRRMEAARARGVDVTADQYPYLASSTGLSSVIPAWAHEGGPAKMLQRIADPEISVRLRREIEAAHAARGAEWSDLFISSVSVPELKQWEGMNIAEIAAARAVDPVTAVFDLLLGGKYVGQVRFGMCEEDVREIMAHPLVMIGSDGSCLATYGPLSAGKPHPRNYGTFVRVLGKYVREDGVLRLAEALRKMTSLPASRMRLEDRGILRPGFAADVTVFDADQVGERATYVDPHQYAAGIKAVVVNGRVTVEDGEHTGAGAGRVLVRRSP